MRNKIISIRVNEDTYQKFLETVAKFTITLTSEYPSGTKKLYYTRFPDKPHTPQDKYTLADLVDEAMRVFIEKYKNQSFKSNT